MTHTEFQQWLDRYVDAWKSYEPSAIGELFAEDADYRHHPADEPVSGREAIIADWLEDPDEPGTYDGHYEPLAIDGENHVAAGWSRYYRDGQLVDEYYNVYLCRFDAQGRCTTFTEWWIRGRQFEQASGQPE